tara:strand:+ start:3620 stop:4333 length:714 start_codon:yes stop_codon:yes gene_type:complete
MSEEKSITIKKSDLWKYLSFFLIAIVLIGGVFMFTDGSPTVNGNTVVQPTQQAGKISASVDDDAVLGDADAPITIIEFSDLECPYCKRHHDETFPLIKSQYIDTGKIKYVFRDFTPTLVNPSYHPNAINAAMAVECVGEQGDEAYWKMLDKVFSNQGSNSLDNLKSLASGLGYDIDNCLDSKKYESEVQKDFVDGQSAGIEGTPGFVIMKTGDDEGTLISGAYPFSTFQEVIETKLA